MIEKIRFLNFRNLEKEYTFNNGLNVIVGKNSSGKSNLLDGIKLAFNSLSGEYFPITKSDFFESDDTKVIEISVVLSKSAIPSLTYMLEEGDEACGFKVIIQKTSAGRYVKRVRHYNGTPVDTEILRDDNNIPLIFSLPLQRIEDLLTPGLQIGISEFITSESKYLSILKDSKTKIKEQISDQEKHFSELCDKFGQKLSINLTDPKFSNEKLYVVDGDKEHNARIGSGFKSIANIIINAINSDYKIFLIDEIENHLHPSLIRNLIREIRNFENIQLISTTHSPVVINEMELIEMIDISGVSLASVKESKDESVKKKLKRFLHPGRNELILSEKSILVEGYSEELILRNYLSKNNHNWSIINVAGIMFEPYIMLASHLSKKIIVISDNDKSLSQDLKKSSRFNNLKGLCSSKNIKLLEVENTLETDLYDNGIISAGFDDLLKNHKTHNNLKISKPKQKTAIAERIIDNDIDLSDWHIIKDLYDEI